MWKEVEGKEPLLLTRSSDGGAVGGDKPKADENNGLLRATYRRVFVERRAVALLFVFRVSFVYLCAFLCWDIRADNASASLSREHKTVQGRKDCSSLCRLQVAASPRRSLKGRFTTVLDRESRFPAVPCCEEATPTYVVTAGKRSSWSGSGMHCSGIRGRAHLHQNIFKKLWANLMRKKVECPSHHYNEFVNRPFWDVAML